MSIEAVQQFWSKAQQDQSLQSKVQAIPADSNSQQVLAQLIRIAGEAGFAFTATDYDDAIKTELARQHAAGEISDEQLAAVAGGVRAINSKMVRGDGMLC